MRLIAPIALAFVLAACQRADPAEESARKVAEATAAAPKPAAAAPMATPAPIEEPSADTNDHHACGGACGASCNGSCGAGCMAAAGDAPKQDVPKDATWASLTVDGMHCGGCARRIQTRLAQLDGVVGSEVDLGTHTVRVAVKKGVDARAIATPAIDELGYHVR